MQQDMVLENLLEVVLIESVSIGWSGMTSDAVTGATCGFGSTCGTFRGTSSTMEEKKEVCSKNVTSTY